MVTYLKAAKLVDCTGAEAISNAAVIVEDGRIRQVGPASQLPVPEGAQVLDLGSGTLMPGLIDAHIHTGDGLLRGVSQDLDNWMQHGLWPFEQELRKDPDAVRKGSMLNILEELKAGTTTFCDFDTPMTEIVQNHIRLGTRARVAELISELPKENRTALGELYQFDPAEGDRKLRRNLRLCEEWNGAANGRITCMLGPQGADMCSRSRGDVARRMAILMTARMDPELMTCRDVVSTGRYPYTGHLGVLRPEDKAIVEQSLRETDALDFADRPFQSISDGQRQRVLLARALCQQPELIVLDEPTSFLDIRYKLELLTILKRMVREEHLAVLMSLHELDLAARVSDTVVCVAGDRIDRVGPPSEIFTPDYIAALYRMEPGKYDPCFDSLEFVPGGAR